MSPCPHFSQIRKVRLHTRSKDRWPLLRVDALFP